MMFLLTYAPQKRPCSHIPESLVYHDFEEKRALEEVNKFDRPIGKPLPLLRLGYPFIL